MKLATVGCSNPSGSTDIDRTHQELLDKLGGRLPDLLVAYYTASISSLVRAGLALDMDAPTLGASSCQGVMTDEGLFGGDGDEGFALLGISDPDGSYGTGYATIGDDAGNAAVTALTDAIEGAGRPGELPATVLLHAPPGYEETIIAAINTVTGGHSPIVGGSAADDDISGNWSVFANRKSGDDGVAMAVLYPSTPVSSAFQSGYEPAGPRATVTAACGRVLQELDGRPAAEVYNEWVGGALDDAFDDTDNNVLAATTMHPIGRQIGSLELHGSHVPYYSLIHPERVTPERGLTLFADVEVGQELLLMEGSKASLIRRAGDVVSSARAGRVTDTAGGFVIYCAGCRLAVADDVVEVGRHLTEAFAGQPFIVGFTFGEQGCLLGGENEHGNLMISACVIADEG